MLVFFAYLNAVDGVSCPDGCTHEEQPASTQHAPESASGICALCLGGVTSAPRHELAPGRVIGDGVELPQFTRLLDAFPGPVEHPPRD